MSALSIEDKAIFFNNLAVIKSRIYSKDNLCEDLEKAYKGKVYQNYHYLYSNCNFRQMTEKCQNCDGTGEVYAGYTKWEGDAHIEARENCYACNGYGRFLIEHMKKPLEFIFDF